MKARVDAFNTFRVHFERKGDAFGVALSTTLRDDALEKKQSGSKNGLQPRLSLELRAARPEERKTLSDVVAFWTLYHDTLFTVPSFALSYFSEPRCTDVGCKPAQVQEGGGSVDSRNRACNSTQGTH